MDDSLAKTLYFYTSVNLTPSITSGARIRIRTNGPQDKRRTG